MVSRITNLFAGEFVLDRMPNGGAAILLRSLWVTMWIYMFAILLKELFEPSSIMFTWDWGNARALISDTLTWLGAIFAAAYAGFYSRFSSQWAYLANLYNLILQVQVEAYLQTCRPKDLDRQDVKSVDGTLGGAAGDFDPMTKWKAAFVEDAEEIHLATKPMYAMIIQDMLKDEKIRKCYIDGTPCGETGLKKLEAKIEAALNRKKKGGV